MNKIISFLKVNWILVISFIYIIWPLDLIPELFGPIGLIDDGFLLLFVSIKLLRDYLKADQANSNNYPKSRDVQPNAGVHNEPIDVPKQIN